MQVGKGKIVVLRGQPIIPVWYVLIWALIVQKVPVEEDMDGWEVKVYILFLFDNDYHSMLIIILIPSLILILGNILIHMILRHKVEFNKNFSKINFFNGLTQVGALIISHIVV